MKTHDLGEAIRSLESEPMVEGSLKIPLEVGLLMRGTIRKWVRYAQDYGGLKVHAFESWGLIESTFSIEIEGKAGRIASVLKTLRNAVPI